MTQNENELSISAWQDFIAHTLPYKHGHPRKIDHLFRGQADASWPLVPSFVRQAEEAGLNAAQALEIELGAIIEFQKAAGLHVPSHYNPPGNDLVAWLILMQHHGVPTRLLDWTTSPFVAVYFAVEQEPDRNGAVWIINDAIIEPFLRSRYPKSMPGPEKESLGIDWDDHTVVWKLFRQQDAEAALTTATPGRQTDRMIAQQTISKVSPQILAKHDDIIIGAVPPEQIDAACKKLIILSDHKREFMRQLRKMNITGGTLFPGIDGHGRSVRELIALDCFK